MPGRAGRWAPCSQGLFPVGLQCTAPCNLSNLDPGQSVSFGSKFVRRSRARQLAMARSYWWIRRRRFCAEQRDRERRVGLIQNRRHYPIRARKQRQIRPRKECHVGPAEVLPIYQRSVRRRRQPERYSCRRSVPGDSPGSRFQRLHWELQPDYRRVCRGVLGAATTTSTHIDGCFVQSVVADTLASSGAPSLGPVQVPMLSN